ncbi:hypothetical protein ACF3NT_14830 [Naumannella halotolerans]|uniref:hypothetical protein n=1 Tax=Naumannella halotolerans TaxID=993414 RepID=UPI00370D704E
MAAVLAVAAAFGQVWIVRAGVAIAIIGGVAALWVAIVQARKAAQQAAEENREQLRREASARSAERAQSQDVLDVLSHYNDDLAAVNDRLDEQRRHANSEIVGLKRRIAALQTEVSTLRGDNAVLQTKHEDRRIEIAELTDLLVAKELELAELRGEEPEASVLELARSAGDPAADDRWSADTEHPTVANMAALKAAERSVSEELPQAKEA